MTPATRLIVLVMFLCAIPGCDQSSPPKEIRQDIAGETFKLELALTAERIQRGMMGRESVGDFEGMLFVFADERTRSFWMKNCLVPLDAIFMDKTGRIVSITTMPVPSEEEADDPPLHSSRWPTQFVIELRGGRAAELKLEAGQSIKLPIKRLLEWID